MPGHKLKSNMAMVITQKTCCKKSFSSWKSYSSVIACKDRKMTPLVGPDIP